LNRSDVVPDLKKKSKVESGYILFEVQNYKGLTLVHLYPEVYLKPGFEKVLDMGKLYIQYKTADCRGEDTEKYKKSFEKVDKYYTNHEILLQEESLEYQKAWTSRICVVRKIEIILD
jgi:hypothetical protein